MLTFAQIFISSWINILIISNAHASYIDQLYQAYREDPQSVDESWQKFFEGFDFLSKSLMALMAMVKVEVMDIALPKLRWTMSTCSRRSTCAS